MSMTACGGPATNAATKDREASRNLFRDFPCPYMGNPEENPAVSDQRYAAFYGKWFSPKITLDYFALRRLKLNIPEAEQGVACSGAPNRDRCLRRLNVLIRNAALTDTSRRAFPIGLYIVTTSGDEVKLWNPEQFAQLLGPIDTPLEAWLMVRTRVKIGVPACGEPGVTVYRPVPNGFEIREQHRTKVCDPFEVVETLHHVGKDGSVRLLDKRIVIHDRDRCIVP